MQAIARLKCCARSAKGLTKSSGDSTNLEEREDAEMYIIRRVQEEAFRDEMKSLNQSKEIQTKRATRLDKLSPFIDAHGVLRVGGKLTEAALHPHVKHPAILPKGHHLSRLLVRHFHERVCHQGRGMTLNAIRSNGFWIIGCSSEVSSIIYR